MKFSIVVPTLNQARFIEAAIRSVVDEQPGTFEVECIVIDGGSTDGSLQILEKLATEPRSGARSLQWVSGRDRGQADAINKGFTRASGDVFAYLNSDDLYASGALARVADAFSAAPTAQWLTGSCRIVDIDGKEIQPGVSAYRNLWLHRYSYTRLRMLNFIPQPATFWRRAAAGHVGSFDETLAYTMDYDFWLRLGKLGAPVVLSDRLADFRLHGSSKSGTAFIRQFDEDYSTFMRTAPGLPLRLFHRLHNAAIVAAYRVLK